MDLAGMKRSVVGAGFIYLDYKEIEVHPFF
jgi:hypothetical protein